MNRYSFKIIVIIIALFGFYQANSQAVNLEGNNVINTYDLTGKPYSSKKGVEGSPMLNEQWGRGWVKLKSGKYVKDALLKFNLESNELYFNRNDLTLSFVDPVREFIMSFEENNKPISVTFRNGYPAISKNDSNSFYQVLGDGKKLQYLKDIDKTIDDLHSYGAASQKYYRQIETFYIYNSLKNTITRINKTKASILEAIPDYAAMVEKYLADKKSRLKTDDEIEDLIQFLNQ